MSRQVSRAIIEVLVRDVLRRKGHRRRPCAGSRNGVRLGFRPGAEDEIVAVGRKLWERQYVDGNGGNISCRLTDDWVLCTPTLMSKGDLRAEDICMVDFDGRQLAACAAARARSAAPRHHESRSGRPRGGPCTSAARHGVRARAPGAARRDAGRARGVHRARRARPTDAGHAGLRRRRRPPRGAPQHHPHGEPWRRDVGGHPHPRGVVPRGDGHDVPRADVPGRRG